MCAMHDSVSALLFAMCLVGLLRLQHFCLWTREGCLHVAIISGADLRLYCHM